MSTTPFKHFHKVLNHLIVKTVNDCDDQDEAITCRKGCSYCCHLLVEIPWEEAAILAAWLMKQPDAKRNAIIQKIKRNAQQARHLFRQKKRTTKFSEPVDYDTEDFPDALCDDYFYKKRRPCPFLTDGCCSAYEARPTVCRLHMVSSPPELCTREAGEHKDYSIPDAIEDLKEQVTPIQHDLADDGRWGQMGVMLEAVLKEVYQVSV